MRIYLGLMVIGTVFALLSRIVGLLDCECAYVMPWDFALILMVIVGGFAMMLPDRGE